MTDTNQHIQRYDDWQDGMTADDLGGWVKWEDVQGLLEQLEAAQEALREIADAPGLEFFNAPEVARRALECVCAEINTRHCPVHGQDSNPASGPESA